MSFILTPTGAISNPASIPATVQTSAVAYYPATAATFTITDFDSFVTYNLSTSNGTVTRTGDTITYTPANPGAGGFLINQRAVNVTVSNPPTALEYLVVAGGGGSGQSFGSAGGAGGYRTASGFAVTPGTLYTVTVGGGGPTGIQGTNGSNSVMATITSTGGGRGVSNQTGGNGGSGGGGSYGFGGGTGTAGQGNNGGGSWTDGTFRAGSGGGGGAGSAGGDGVPNGSGNGVGGNAGNGLQSSITGTATFYAGGGAGNGNATPGSAGTQGGVAAGVNAGANTGSGGGADGGNGGSGIVVIRYPDTFGALTSTTGSPTVTVAGGFRVYVWTGSGSFRV